jgi:hypothetical protein
MKLRYVSWSDETARSLIREWDLENRAKRRILMRLFLKRYDRTIVPPLQAQLGTDAHLLFARITSSLKLTYSLSFEVSLHLKCVGIFLRSDARDEFLDEFVDSGGLITTLDILSKENRPLDVI